MTVFGLGLETGLADAAVLLAEAAAADHEGLDVVSVTDHPYFADRLDAYAAIGMVLGATSRLSAAVNVSNVATRPAPMLARQITSLSALSGGRLVAGIGAGGLWDEIGKLGIPRRTPGESIRAMAEAIVLLRALSGGGAPVTFTGEFYSVTGLQPADVPTPPIWTGALGRKALQVTGRLADGWLPGHAADWVSARVRQSRPLIDQAAAAAGRQPGDVATIYNLPGRITPEPLHATRDRDGRWIGGSARQWADELTRAVTEHRAGGFILFPTGDRTDQLRRWAREVVPAVRESLGQPGLPQRGQDFRQPWSGGSRPAVR